MVSRFFVSCKIPAVLIFFVTLVFVGCGRDSVVTSEETRITMGTVAHLTVRADEIAGQAALRDGMAVLAQTERDADGASITAMEDAAGTGAWTEISPALYETLSLAQEVARHSDGAFDVTAGTLTALWEQAHTAKVPPTEAEIAAARARVGYESLELRTVEGSGQTKYEARLMKAGMRIDRGALIKGLALDGIRTNWQAAGIQNALADLGASSILGMGTNEAGEPWQIGVRNPRGADRKDMLMVLSLSDEVLSASGDDERYFIYEGRRFHHLIDPRTGYPAETGLASVTVILPLETEDSVWRGHMGLLSDMLSTAVFVLGAEAGRQLLADFPEALVIMVGMDGQLLGE